MAKYQTPRGCPRSKPKTPCERPWRPDKRCIKHFAEDMRRETKK